VTPAEIKQALQLASGIVEKFEGLDLNPYLCPAGIPTIGYGSTFYEDGRKVSMSDPAITKERAQELMQNTLSGFCGSVLLRCPEIKSVALLAACTDLAYNIGVHSFRSSTVARLIGEGDLAGLPAAFRMWVKANGKVLRGLERRREAEIALFHSV